LWLVVLAGDIQNVGADNFGDIGQNLGESFGVIGFIDVSEIAFVLSGRRGVADIVDIEAEGFRQVIESVQAQFGPRHRRHDGFPSSRAKIIGTPVGGKIIGTPVGGPASRSERMGVRQDRVTVPGTRRSLQASRISKVWLIWAVFFSEHNRGRTVFLSGQLDSTLDVFGA